MVGVGLGLVSGGTNPNEEAKIIKDNLVHLSTVEVGSWFENLKGLKDILQDRQIIVIGVETNLWNKMILPNETADTGVFSRGNGGVYSLLWMWILEE